ncbi:hypothetical protein BJ1_gp61 [Halorubrum virus BJ1]|uniref:Uncharacterized protein n=1 Tax=Halorubrum virus BJ1 TaxID=416419 RepID=A0ZYS4_9CAUD|nr:hypothetical protein BJ1_gp61 [Halorubrum virus BJ1]CAL92483.1 hypothetical protein [Halorubrum virus BJ1]
MLASETTTLAEAQASLEEHIDALADSLTDLDASTDEYDAVASQRDRLQYLHDGVEWQAEEWGDDAEVTVGALTAGEEAMMHREIPDGAGERERRLWYVAAASDSGPYVGDDLSATFANVSDLHPAFVAWVEARSNALGVAGNRSSTSSTESASSGTSTPTPDSTT